MNDKPAFPIHAKWDDLKDDRHKEGMTIHQYMATAALKGLLSDNANVIAFGNMARQFKREDCDLIAEACYEYTTALLAKYEEKEK